MRIVLALLVGIGCKASDKPAAKTEQAVAPVAPVADAAVAVADAAPADAAIEDPAARATFRKALQKGRKAIAAKSYADAIAALDAALAAKPGDPRALTERGYARLLEGKDLDAASKDFDVAAGATKDPKLLSMIWFNRGLVDEKRGNADNARAAFALANALRPTKAAQDKLAGKATCMAIVERGAGDAKPVVAKDWLALAKALPHDDETATPEAAAKELTDDGKEPTLPAVVVASDLGEHVAFAVWRAKDGLRALELARAMWGRCPGSVDFTIAESDARRLLVHGTFTVEGGHTYMCQDPKNEDELIECEGKDDEISAGTACLGGSPSVLDIVIDVKTGLRVLQVEQLDEGTEADVKLVETGAQLVGRGCDRLEKL